MRALFIILAVMLAVKAEAKPVKTDPRSYPCWLVRWYVNSHSKQQQHADARKYKVTREERDLHAVCFKDKK